MKKITALAALAALTGCLSSAPKAPTYWTIEIDADAPAYASVAVAAPFDGQEFAVLRPDGSIAFDAYNAFAARPMQLLRVGAKPQTGPAITVRRLALDCRVKGERMAVVELTATDGQTARSVVATSPTGDGNYTRAFSAAFRDALRQLSK